MNWYEDLEERNRLEKEKFLADLGIDIQNPPAEFQRQNQAYKWNVPWEERDMLFWGALTPSQMLPVCIKDIYGTSHVDYYNMTFLESFLKSKRGAENLEAFYNHPEYYFVTLKTPNQEGAHDTPLELNRDSKGHYYIIGGNNRINILMMLYLSEIRKAKTEEERIAVDEKYTFYAQVKAVPKNKDIIHVISLLKQSYGEKIKICFCGTNPDDCCYEIILDGKKYEITTVEQLKKLLYDHYAIESLTNMYDLIEKVSELVADYFSNNGNEEKKKLLREVCPNIDSIIEVVFKIRRFPEEILKSMPVKDASYKNIESILQVLAEEVDKMIKEEELEIAKKRFEKVSSYVELSQAVIAFSTKCRELGVDPNTILPNYTSFTKYLDDSRGMFSLEKEMSYEELYDLVLETAAVVKKSELLDAMKKEKEYGAQVEQLERALKALTNKSYYQKVVASKEKKEAELEEKEIELEDAKAERKVKESEREEARSERTSFMSQNALFRIFQSGKKNAVHARVEEAEASFMDIDERVRKLEEEIASIREDITTNEADFLSSCGLDITMEQCHYLLMDCRLLGYSPEKLEEEIRNLKKAIRELRIEELRNYIASLPVKEKQEEMELLGKEKGK